jgi:uncharacterized protein
MLNSWLVRVFAGLILVCACLMAYAYFIEPSRLVLREAEIPIHDLDPGFDGMKIVMISDIHGGSNNVTPEKLRQVTALANAQDADLIVLLGDYVSESSGLRPARNESLRLAVAEIADGLTGIRGKLGVFAVLGNHDGWFGDDRIAPELERAGIRVLQNEVAVVQRNGRPLRILGFKDHLHLSGKWLETSADAKRLLEPTGDGDIIALEHSPDIFPVITGEMSISPKLRLVLAAHTHGGQVWLPLAGRPIVPSMFGQKYAYGHINENDVDMYVTSGVGTSILPFRFLVPPEVAVITLRSR